MANNTYIAGFGVSSTGALSVLTSSPIHKRDRGTIISSHTRQHVPVCRDDNGIYGYTINSNGSITVLNSGNSLAQDVIPTAMQVEDRLQGGYLFTGFRLWDIHWGTSHRYIYGHCQHGSVDRTHGFPLLLSTPGKTSTPTVVSPTSMLITPNNSIVYVSLATLGVQVLTLGTGGALSTGTEQPLPFCRPQHLDESFRLRAGERPQFEVSLRGRNQHRVARIQHRHGRSPQ